MWFLSSSMDETKMKAAMRLLNWLYSEEGSRTIMIGLEGEVWSYDSNGVAKFTDAALQGLKDSVENSYQNSQNFYKYISIIGRDYGSLGANGQPLDLRLEPDYVKESLSVAEKEYSEFFGAEVPSQVMGNRKNYSTYNRAYQSLTSSDVPTEVSRINTSVLNYMVQEYQILSMLKHKRHMMLRLRQLEMKLRIWDMIR
jgi:putative aldouronate transport system substrate-binding protein